MMDIIEEIEIERVTVNSREKIIDVVTKELPLTIVLNNQEIVTMLCSPTDLKYLAVGFLSSEGLIKSKDEIKKISVDDQKGIVRIDTVEDKNIDIDLVFKRVLTSGCGRGASFYSFADMKEPIKIESRLKISASSVLKLVHEFQQSSEVHKSTRGVHSAALCDTNSILVFTDDIGRHNAIDKIFGECILNDIPTTDRMIVTSGRISSEILLKVAKRNVPILASPSAPTNLGVRLANQIDITLIGFVRGHRMNIYSGNWRVATDAT